MAEKSWQGPSNGNWSVAANWSGGTVPVSGDVAYIEDTGVTVDAAANTAGVNIILQSATLQIAAGAVAGNGTVTMYSSFIVCRGAFGHSMDVQSPWGDADLYPTARFIGTSAKATNGNSQTIGSVGVQFEDGAECGNHSFTGPFIIKFSNGSIRRAVSRLWAGTEKLVMDYSSMLASLGGGSSRTATVINTQFPSNLGGGIL